MRGMSKVLWKLCLLLLLDHLPIFYFVNNNKYGTDFTTDNSLQKQGYNYIKDLKYGNVMQDEIDVII